MSYLTYIASDYPLPIFKNPHEQLLSINEALALVAEAIRQLEEKDLLGESDELYGLPVQYRLLITKQNFKRRHV